MAKAFLVLDDGRIFEGKSWAATGRTFGEAVFQTGMTGYQETLTDPSYHRQVVVMTAPHIGNTGVNTLEDNESQQDLGGRICSAKSIHELHSNWRSEKDLEVRASLSNQSSASQVIDTQSSHATSTRPRCDARGNFL
jgi:carbamoyl-phosphate synthase small subunit